MLGQVVTCCDRLCDDKFSVTNCAVVKGETVLDVLKAQTPEFIALGSKKNIRCLYMSLLTVDFWFVSYTVFLLPALWHLGHQSNEITFEGTSYKTQIRNNIENVVS